MMIVKTLHFSQTFPKNISTSRIKTYLLSNIRPPSVLKISNSTSISEGRLLVNEFDPKLPIEKALTPPSSWYTDPSFLSLEFDRIFHRGWQFAGYTEQVKEAGDFFTGRLGYIEYVVCRDDNGELRAFHNVCRHHASLLSCGSGKKTCFTCPYHGWTYGLNGKLLKATRITGIKDFNVNEFGLVPIRVASWGPFILLNLESDLFSCQDSEVDSSLSYLCRREYTIECKWKVFCDNFLDGGYHVPYVHKSLAGLNYDSYSYSMFEKVSILRSDSDQVESQVDTDRPGSQPLYAFIYPNFMVNWLGSWMNTNLVLPLGLQKCQVISDYSFNPSLKAPSGNSWLGSLIATIIGNLKITISNVHVRYEDSTSNPGNSFACGVTLAKLAAVTMDEQGNETFDTSGALDKLRKTKVGDAAKGGKKII